MIADDLIVYGDENVQVPAHLNFGKFILHRLRSQSDEVALENGETRETLTYNNLTQYAVNMATALQDLGVRHGDIVAVGSEKRFEIVAANFAIVFTGAAYTAYDLDSGKAILMHKLNITKPSFFICSITFWDKYRQILEGFDCIKKIIAFDKGVKSLTSIEDLVTNDVDINKFEPVQVQGQIDTACIFYSSGTTGMSKGVQITHLNCIMNSLPHEFDNESLQTAFIYGEWYHNYDTFATYKFIAMGKKIVYCTYPLPQTILKSIDDCKINIAFIEPYSIICMANEREIDIYNLDSLKIIYSSSMPLHSNTIALAKKSFPKVNFIYQGYGMTEVGFTTSEGCGSKGPKIGSVGTALPGITIKVADLKTRKSLGPNQHGEISLRGPTLMKGYIGIDQSTIIDQQGFFGTGDLGYYDEDNYFYITGRQKDIICYEGESVCPLELENILQWHPGVREAKVIGRPGTIFGEEPTAFVVKQPGVDVTENDLVEYVKSQVPSHMQLRGGVKFIEEIPRNHRGKIMRQRLQEILY